MMTHRFAADVRIAQQDGEGVVAHFVSFDYVVEFAIMTGSDEAALLTAVDYKLVSCWTAKLCNISSTQRSCNNVYEREHMTTAAIDARAQARK